jgi:hypothetical protein
MPSLSYPLDSLCICTLLKANPIGERVRAYALMGKKTASSTTQQIRLDKELLRACLDPMVTKLYITLTLCEAPNRWTKIVSKLQ